MTPPEITTRAWTPLTPRATPVPATPDTTTGKPGPGGDAFGETQLSTDAWERVFVRALPGDAGYLVHRAWYALDWVEDGWRHDRGGPLDAVSLSLWQWWLLCRDYRDPDGTEVHHQAYLDPSMILAPHTSDEDLAPFQHLPRTYADAYPVGSITWNGHPETAIYTRSQLEAVTITESHRLLGNLWVGAYRTDNPRDAHGRQRGGAGVLPSPASHSMGWHSATAAHPDICHVHPDQRSAVQSLVRARHGREPIPTDTEGQASS